jgi:hypothetical protein
MARRICTQPVRPAPDACKEAGDLFENRNKNNLFQVGAFLASQTVCSMTQGAAHVETLVADSW